jgi:hypothetical protein
MKKLILLVVAIFATISASNAVFRGSAYYCYSHNPHYYTYPANTDIPNVDFVNGWYICAGDTSWEGQRGYFFASCDATAIGAGSETYAYVKVSAFYNEYAIKLENFGGDNKTGTYDAVHNGPVTSISAILKVKAGSNPVSSYAYADVFVSW